MNFNNLLVSLTILSLARADDIDCIARTEKGTQCAATIPANQLGLCPGGYTRETVEAPGLLPGIYCNRGCTASEQADCNMLNCKDYSRACSPGTPISCTLAVNYCQGVVSDYICENAPGYGKCEYTDLCQSEPCCPPPEKNSQYINTVRTTFKKEGKLRGFM